MTRYAALLRGINVGGKALVPMAELRAVVAALGHDEVQTYIQSGNVLFGSSARPATLVPALEKALRQAFGRPIGVLLRSHEQLAAVLERNPLVAAGRDPAHGHITFLSTRPAAATVAALDHERYAPDEFAVVGTEVYVHCPGGYGRTKIHNAFFERVLGVTGTTRNLRTTGELVRRTG